MAVGRDAGRGPSLSLQLSTKCAPTANLFRERPEAILEADFKLLQVARESHRMLTGFGCHYAQGRRVHPIDSGLEAGSVSRMFASRLFSQPISFSGPRLKPAEIPRLDFRRCESDCYS